MLLESLTLCDFGLFRGAQAIDLNPRKKYGSARPIVLFGGLNGAGKTTVLTAIRLAIYGRQALGYGISQKAYDEFLASKIHRSPHSLVMPSSAHIGLEFTYYKLGKPTNYKITRSWVVSGKQLNETLSILQDGEPIREFDQEQCQAFLNELIPLGVSELFFFDGEKIASLADEGGDVALRDAIRKLLGLDIIERLKSDLHIFIRRQNNKSLPDNLKSELSKYEAEYKELKLQIQAEDDNSQILLPRIADEKLVLARLENQLSSKGGVWANTRQSLKTRRDMLLSEKKSLEEDVRNHLADLYPLTLAPKLLKSLQDQLRQERELKEWNATANAVTLKLEQLKGVIDKYIPNANKAEASESIHKVFSDLVTRPSELMKTKILHDLANKEYLQLESSINEILSQVPQLTKVLSDRLNTVNEELGNVSLQIERAPDQESLQSDFDAIKQTVQLIAELTAERNNHLEKARRLTWQAIEIVRKMKKVEDQLSSTSSQDTGVGLAGQTRNLLSDFADEMTKRKIEKLEQEFARTFSRLARKSDSIISAKIDPSTFEVHLYNKSGKGIPKQDLSAGEKQIYAVAMLDALGKTSGRKLPIIIDTPLGRLDSRHREKLINNYFPNASHQVIILSTDTEVDQSFYDELDKYVSHAYQINYDENEGASTVKEGYFWKSNLDSDEVLSRAS